MNKLQVVHFKKGCHGISANAFMGCPSLRKFDVDNSKYFYGKGSALVTQRDRELIMVAPAMKNVTVPKGVRILGKNCFSNSSVQTLVIPNTVVRMVGALADASHLTKVTLQKGNREYGMDGQCIYNKTNGALIAGVAKNKKLKISDSVKEINEEFVVCGDGYEVGDGGGIEELDIASSVRTLRDEWMEGYHMSVGGTVYFRGDVPPNRVGRHTQGCAQLPVFMKVYVPKKSIELYKKWYEELECYQYLGGGKLNAIQERH